MLASLAPARRRFFLVLGGLALTLVAVVVVLAVARGGGEVDPVAQEERGPVVLLPGYGGSTASLDVLAVALRGEGREVTVFDPPGDGTGDLRDQAEALDEVVDDLLEESGAASVDVVGYSNGGVVARTWVAEEGGGSLARRVVTLGSPHHGTVLADLAGGLAGEACAEACRQVVPDSDFLARLNRDETPPGPRWVAVWTEDDQVVVPPSSGDLEGATSYAVQDVCPGLVVSHGDLPRSPEVVAMVVAALEVEGPTVPGDEVCVSR